KPSVDGAVISLDPRNATRCLFLPAQFHKPSITYRHLAAGGVAVVHQDAVAELQMLALRQAHEISLALHRGVAGLATAERVGGPQAVATAVPTRGIRILRIRQDRQSRFLAVDRAGVIAPGRDLSPTVRFAELALGVLELAFANFVGANHVVDANAEGAFLRVA